MLFRAIAVIAVAGISALAVPTTEEATVIPHRGCATYISPEQQILAEQRFAHTFSSLNAFSDVDALVVPPIPVYWHIIYKDQTVNGGYIPDSQVTDSITAMNDHFKDTGITFELKETTRTLNADWFSKLDPDGANQTAMKESLRVGDAATLNVYSVGFETGAGSGLLGYATFPEWYEGAPKDDGVVILHSSVPGGATGNYNEGKTLTHEVGHWIGLYHVFQGGCSGAGDSVDDTPPQRTATNGCPTSQDSCPGGGVDSVHNFMDYSYDSCMFEWTKGQLTRAKAQILTYRKIEVPGTPGSSSSSSPSSTSSSTSSSSSSSSSSTVAPPSSSTTTTTPTPTPSSTSTRTTTKTSTTTTKDCPWYFPWCWFQRESNERFTGDFFPQETGAAF